MMSCPNCYKAFEAGYEESEKAYIGTIEGLRARVAELTAAGLLLATQGREMATGLCSDTREVSATGVCSACQERMSRYINLWRAAMEGQR